MAAITIVRAGLLTSVQDLGRARWRSAGVSVGGALDSFAARVANLLVRNPEESALLELTLGGLRIRFEEERRIAWCGGEFTARIGATKIPAGRPAFVRAKEELDFEAGPRGCRAWLAIAGGIDLPYVLGSRATDLRAGFGGWEGRALRDGDPLSLGPSPADANDSPRLASWGAPTAWARTAARPAVLQVVQGAEWNEFTPEARTMFLKQAFAVSPRSDRMGARLAGAALQRTHERELLSEAVTPGTVQVANDGQPIVLLGDCQTIGGYPKIAHVISVDLPRAAQLQPNENVRFREVSLANASTLFLERENDLQRFRVGLALRGS